MRSVLMLLFSDGELDAEIAKGVFVTQKKSKTASEILIDTIHITIAWKMWLVKEA